ncbi:MAG: hypothetical protein APF81_01080 [Desulfosporosinus sp. BRH_c37]|nr:MAG: hypothetical protein APF81_01080 [Desulfosporosinus sp. BRH_c37]
MKPIKLLINLFSIVFIFTLTTFQMPNTVLAAEEEIVSDHSFVVIPESTLNLEQETFVQESRKEQGIYQKGNFFVIALGQAPNPGYAIEFVKQETRFEQVIVFLKIIKPEPDTPYPTVISYPYIAGTIDLPPYTTISFLDSGTSKAIFEPEKTKWSNPNEDGVTYQINNQSLTLSWGEKSSSGYEISIDSLEWEASEIIVTYSLVKPATGKIVLPALTYPVATATIPKNEQPVSKVTLLRNHTTELLEERQNTSLNKQWTIRFSMPIDMESVTEKTVYVTEKSSEVETMVDTQLVYGQDEQTVVVQPLKSYRSGHTYVLHVTQNILSKSIGNQMVRFLQAEVQMPFKTITPISGENLISE